MKSRPLTYACLLAALQLLAGTTSTAQPAEVPVHILGVDVGPDGEARVYCRRHMAPPSDLGDVAAINAAARKLFPERPDLSALRWHENDVFVKRASVSGKTAQSATFQVDYTGFTPEAEDAFQHAVDLWSTWIESDVPIEVDANWSSLEEDVLGSAGPQYFDDAQTGDTWYAAPLANALRGVDDQPNYRDILANFNNDFDNWYFGLDGQTPSGKIDFVTVVLHEIGHGLGFLGSMKVDDGDSTDTGVECSNTAGYGCWGFKEYENIPVIYDRYAEDASGNRLINTTIYPNPSRKLGDALTAGEVFFAGSSSISVYGARPPLYAPQEWSSGSSYAHLDESTFGPSDPSALMTPSISTSEAVHDPGPVGCAVFDDIGWVVASDCKLYINPPAPVVPTAVSPSDGEDDVAIPVLFEWTKATGADSYQIQVSEGSDFDAVVVDTAVVDVTHVTIDDLERSTTYIWRVRAVNAAGRSVWTKGLQFTTATQVGAEDDPDIPREVRVTAVYPNPFRERIHVEVALPEAGRLRLSVFDVRGRRLEILVDERRPAGVHTITWAAGSQPSGMYLFKVEAGRSTTTAAALRVRSAR